MYNFNEGLHFNCWFGLFNFKGSETTYSRMRTEINGGRYPIQRSSSIESTTNLPQINNNMQQPADMLTTQIMQPAGDNFLPTTTQDSEVEYPTDFEPFENHYDGNNPFLKPFADQMGLSLQQQFTDIRLV